MITKEQAVRPSEAKAQPTVELVVSLPPVAVASIQRVLAETGDPVGTMVAKALGFYMMALEARKRGQTVGAADSPDVLDTEFTGF